MTTADWPHAITRMVGVWWCLQCQCMITTDLRFPEWCPRDPRAPEIPEARRLLRQVEWIAEDDDA